MESVILPIATFYFALGGTMNMYNYDDYSEKAIFDDSNIIKKEYEAVLNSTYQVLQEDRLPYSDMRLPIDLLLRVKLDRFPTSINYDVPRAVREYPIHDVAAIVIVTELITGKHTLRQNAEPVPGWLLSVPITSTHYADEVIFGGKCIAKVEVKSSVIGDVQIIRKIFTDVMGTSGHFLKKHTKAYTEVWKYAMRAAQESPDVRGHVYVDYFSAYCTNIELPREAKSSFENYLKYLPNISVSQSVEEEQRTLYVRLKPIHSFDTSYPKIEKNKQSEEYLTSLDVKLDDLGKVLMDSYLLSNPMEENITKGAFWTKVDNLNWVLKNLARNGMSIYKDIDIKKLDKYFQRYKTGLEGGDKDYFSAGKKIREKLDMSCGNKFYKPTSGVLIARDDETLNIKSVKEDLRTCKNYCKEDEHCRAIGYDKTKPDMCRIYSVSTNTADIYSEEDNSVKIYDRQCSETGEPKDRLVQSSKIPEIPHPPSVVIPKETDPGMADVILPISSTKLTLGGTYDLLTYDHPRSNSLFSDSDLEENPVDILNSTYYVIQDGKLPYSAMRLPIDLVRRVKSRHYYPETYVMNIPKILKASKADRMTLVTLTEYARVQRSIKENAKPISGWQESHPKTQTHYADKMYYGGRCISKVEIGTQIPGDIQLVGRIFTDIMGSSGEIRENTVDLWKIAMKTVDESPDVRGYTYFKAFGVECEGISLPSAAHSSLESLLEGLANVKNLTYPYDKENRGPPIYASFKPLRSLDDEYPALEKNKVSEEYLVLLDEKLDDLALTYEKFQDYLDVPSESEELLIDFTRKVYDLRSKASDIFKSKPSIYKDLDLEMFEDFFRSYEAGLKHEGKNYYSMYKSLVEDIATSCTEEFLKPTSGILDTTEGKLLSEASDEDEECEELEECQLLAECQEHCKTDERCRAFGYEYTTPNQCFIYYRSTNTANIITLEERSSMKVYDRKCRVTT